METAKGHLFCMVVKYCCFWVVIWGGIFNPLCRAGVWGSEPPGDAVRWRHHLARRLHSLLALGGAAQLLPRGSPAPGAILNPHSRRLEKARLGFPAACPQAEVAPEPPCLAPEQTRPVQSAPGQPGAEQRLRWGEKSKMG